MSTLRQAGRALQTTFGFALLAALALVNGCASGAPDSASGQPSEPSREEAMEAAVSAHATGTFTCTRANGTPGSLVVLPNPAGTSPCQLTATELPGSSKLYCTSDGCPTCKYLVEKLGCSVV